MEVTNYGERNAEIQKLYIRFLSFRSVDITLRTKAIILELAAKIK